MTRRTFLAAAAAPLAAGTARTSMGLATTCYMTTRRFSDTMEFLEHAAGLGAGGIQASLSSLDPAWLARLRGRAAELGMYLEVMAELPLKDQERFAATVAAARSVGALAVRTVAPGHRRYEGFATAQEWKRLSAEAVAALRRAVPVAEKHRVPLAVENHRDWVLDEFLDLLREFSSEYLGVCLDFGNNLALLDDPHEAVDKLAPFAVSTHVKDMAVQEAPGGFLLVEFPLGRGALDLKRMLAAVRSARPATRMTLEMITRDPTSVPCLTEKYWTAMPARDARTLVRTLTFVRAHAPATPLPTPQKSLDRDALARLEEDNVRACLAYIADR